MPEALARADYDYTVSEDPPPRRRARPRNSGRIEPTVSRVPQMREGAGRERSMIVNGLLVMIRQPLRTIVALASGAIVVSFLSNLLFMQQGPHPAPLFSKPEIASAAPSAPSQGAEPAPPVVASVPLRQPVEPPPPLPPSASRSAPVSIVSAPPPRPVESAKPPTKQPDFDPIAQFLRGGVPPAPTTTASTSGPSPAETKRVAAAQRALTKLGHKLDTDGVLGPGTRAAIQKFERDSKLPVTGELNPRTIKALSARASIPIP